MVEVNNYEIFEDGHILSHNIYMVGMGKIHIPRLRARKADKKPIVKAFVLALHAAVDSGSYVYDTRHFVFQPGSGFRRTLSMLKHALGDQWLTVDGYHVSLNSSRELWVDVSQFRLLMKEATHLHGSSDEIDDWQFLQQESLREQCAFALEMLVEKYRSLAQYKSAIHYAQK